jgi:hypothetical protein
MNAAGTDILVFLVVVGLRLAVPLLIPRFPLPAILACLVIDAADQTIFQQLTDLNLDGYQSYDKALDIYYLTVAYTSVLRNWTDGFAISVARFLWYYRLVGVLLFEITQERWFLFIFPNTFEYYFIAMEAIRLGWDQRRLTKRAVIGITAFIWIVIKLPQEWWIHIAQNDFTDFMKETVFGVDGTDSWGTAFSNRPLVLAAIVLVLVGVALVALHYWRRRPTQDWPLRFDSDRQRSDTVTGSTDGEQPALAWPRLEKVVLISLTAAIFSRVLQVEARGWQIVLGVAVVVLVNAGISTWMARRGSDWRSIGIEMVVLTVVNAIVIQVVAGIVGDRMNRGQAWFFAYLLALIIVLYDRFRARLIERSADPAPTPSGP